VQDGWRGTAIEGVLERRLTTHADTRGAFTELWRDTWTAPLASKPFVQSNLSRSRAGVLRGMHFHLRQSDLWVVVDGRALVATVDLRAGASGWSQAAVQTLELEVGSTVLIPERVAHGFLALSDLALVYFVTQEFDDSDEHGFAWDDPTARIPWAMDDPILSDRDRSNPPLARALEIAGRPG
jgi:dTDP-4-dehydrorhamnose 3,5-epimerase